MSLSKALLFLALVCFALSVRPSGAKADEPFRVILISDTHLGFKKSNEAFETFLKEVQTLPFNVNVLINNGDIAEVGKEDVFEKYKHAIQSLGLTALDVIGNHDTRWTPSGKELFVHAIGPRYFSKDFGGIHWIFLDSTLEHQTQGHIDRLEIAWLKNDLKKLPPQEPILVFSHHPLKWRSMSVDDGLDVLNLLNPYPVAAFFNGHGHKLENLTFRGIPFLENDALFDRHYLILEKSGDAVKLYVKTLGESGLKPWVDLHLHPAVSCLRLTESCPPDAPAWLQIDRQAPEPLKSLEEVRRRPWGIGWHDLRIITPESPWGADETRIFIPGKTQVIPIGEIYAGLAGNGRLVFGGTLGGTLFALNPDGKIVWTSKLDSGILAAPYAEGETVYVGTSGTQIRYGVPVRGGSPDGGRSGTASPDGDTSGGSLYALHARSGKILWRIKRKGSFPAPPVVSGDTLYIGCGDKNLYAFDKTTGKERWHRTLGEFTEMQPLVDAGKVFVGAWDHTFYAINAHDGQIAWRKNIGKAIYYSPSVARAVASQGTVYVAAKDHHVYALDEETGKEKWRKDTNDTFSSPLLVGDELILPEINGRLVAVNSGTGEMIWSKQLESAQVETSFYNASPLMDGNALYLVSVEGNYFKVNLRDRSIGDSFRVSRGWNFSTPVILGNKIWIGSLDGNLYAIPIKPDLLDNRS